MRRVSTRLKTHGEVNRGLQDNCEEAGIDGYLENEDCSSLGDDICVLWSLGNEDVWLKSYEMKVDIRSVNGKVAGIYLIKYGKRNYFS